jgi:Protein of unknown function (DUF3179)
LPGGAHGHGRIALTALAGVLLAPGLSRVQPAGPTPAVTEYPIRFATHAAPSESAAPRDVDLVVGVVTGGEARAYPVNLLWGESAHTVNDDLGRTPVAVALCPLAGVSAAFDRRRGRETVELGHVSETRLDTLVLYDARTRSRWGLLSGEAFEGPLAHQRLERLPTLFTTWGRWKALHPETTVYVAPEEAARGFELDATRIQRILLAGSGPPRRGDWVVGLEGRKSSVAVLLRGLRTDRILNDTLEDRPFAVFLTSDLATALAWSRQVDRRQLTFRAEGDRMVDAETGSEWDGVSGRALSGPLAGRTLSALPVTTGFWHAWKAHHPETRVVGLPAE